MQQHLENIEESRAVEGDGTTILKREALSATPWLDELIRRLPGSVDVARLIRQAGQTWQVSSVILLSLVPVIVVVWICFPRHAELVFERAARNRCRPFALPVSLDSPGDQVQTMRRAAA